MSTSIKVAGLSKVFSISEKGGGPVSLSKALRLGKFETKVREICALEDISFEVAEGERIGIIGPNGAGKTTLLSLLAGITKPTSGTIEIEGDIHAMLTIGAVLREEMTGRENIYLDAAVHGRSKQQIEAVVEDVIAFSELDEFIERPVRTYSSGMKARLAFSMGAFIKPDILILDETLAVGDVFFSQKAGRRMKEIAAQGLIVILVTHSTGAIVEMCTRCLWIDNGRIVMDGDPAEVTSAYERIMRDADEAALMRKFDVELEISKRPEVGKIDLVSLEQGGELRKASVAAFDPLTVRIAGSLLEFTGDRDLQVNLLRVDGRRVWHAGLRQAGHGLPNSGNFEVRLTLDPFILGADLYRLDVTLVDEEGVCDLASRIFEVVDEEGQIGGNPMLLIDPKITARPLTEKSS